MKLVVRAENVCGSPTSFVLLGQEPKGPPDDGGSNGSSMKADAIVVDLTQEFHTVITIEGGPVQPGAIFHKEVELDYDVRSLQWIVPPKNKYRFVLHELRWGDHNLIKEAGRI